MKQYRGISIYDDAKGIFDGLGNACKYYFSWGGITHYRQTIEDCKAAIDEFKRSEK